MSRTALIGLWLIASLGCNGSDTTAESAPDASVPSASQASVPSALPSASASASAELPAREPPTDLWGDKTEWDGTREEENAHMLDLIAYHHGIDEAQRERLEAIIAQSDVLSQGNPEVAQHAASVAACRAKLEQQHVSYERPENELICGAKYMAPIFDPEKEKAVDAKACIDLFEFPDIPCTYPATWVRANEAVAMCSAMGKRLCDAHEWEGACQGKLESVEESYDFSFIKVHKSEDAVKAMRSKHNLKNHFNKRWAYGDAYKKGVCATASRKSKDCGSGWRRCGTNTFPTGFYPTCVSPLGVYDLHGNAAEHMNLPLAAEQLSTAPEQIYGHTEMKGSWFVFDLIRAHDDECRWRAPYWHGTTVMNDNSHRNYHLGFRCCKSLP